MISEEDIRGGVGYLPKYMRSGGGVGDLPKYWRSAYVLEFCQSIGESGARGD